MTHKLVSDEETTVTGVMIQVSEVKKWLEHAIEGKRGRLYIVVETELPRFFEDISFSGTISNETCKYE